MSGRVLTSSALLDIAEGRSVYGAAFFFAATDLGMTLATPSTAVLAAWAGVDPSRRPLLDLLMSSPSVVVDDLDHTTAVRAGTRCAAVGPARAPGSGPDLEAAHVVESARERGLTILTADPAPVRRLDPEVDVELLPPT